MPLVASCADADMEMAPCHVSARRGSDHGGDVRRGVVDRLRRERLRRGVAGRVGDDLLEVVAAVRSRTAVVIHGMLYGEVVSVPIGVYGPLEPDGR